MIMENYKKNAIQLLSNLGLTEKKYPSVIPYSPQKTRVNGKESKYFPRRIGGKAFRLASRLSSMLEELEGEERANIHSIMVIHGGEVVCEASAPGYDTNIFHLAHSMSKTVTGLAIGCLFDEGKLDLDEKIVNIFPEESYKDERFTNMTVRHLLSMRSGVPFAELGSVTEENWTRAFFDGKLSFSPGEKFFYNSMNSYILAKAVARISGMSLSEYVNEKLFSKLHIDNFFWEMGPENSEKGGFGLYLSAESFAKIGFMLLSCGVFEGERIISENYIDLMTSVFSDAPDSTGIFDYGLHLWITPDGNEFLLNGMLGQNVWICPGSDIVVSLNSGNNELFSDSASLAIIRKYLSSISENTAYSRREYKTLKYRMAHFFESRRRATPLEERHGLAYLLKIKNARPFDTRWEGVLGEYVARDNNSGILPLFVRIMQNNYLGGIEKISLSRIEDNLVFSSVEGGKLYEFPVGLYDFCESTLDFGGEKYIVRGIGEAAENEDGNPVYKIELNFPELPNTKIIKITHAPDGILFKMSETPNQRVAESYLASISESSKFSFVIGLVEKKMGEGFLSSKLNSMFNPSLNLISSSLPGWQQVIQSDNLRLAEEREKASKFLKSIISKFIGDGKEEKPKEERMGIQGFFAKALSLLFKKAEADSSTLKSKETDDGTSVVIDIPDDIITFLDEKSEE